MDQHQQTKVFWEFSKSIRQTEPESPQRKNAVAFLILYLDYGPDIPFNLRNRLNSLRAQFGHVVEGHSGEGNNAS